MISRFAPSCSLAGILAGLAPIGAAAQDYAHVAPRAPAPAARPDLATPALGAHTAGSPDVEILPVLKGIVFVSGVKSLTPDGLAAVEGQGAVRAEGLTLPAAAAFLDAMRPYLGKRLSQADLEAIRARTKSWFVAHRQPFVEITVPPQNIASGVIQVVVTEYRLGAVQVVGEKHFKESVVRRPMTLKAGQPLTLDAVQADLDRLNQNPFLSVDAVFKPGAATGVTDLQLVAKDRRPLRVYAGYDNQGYPRLDRQEFFVGVNWANAFGAGQVLSYQYTQGFNGRFTSHSVSDVIPLTGDDRLLIFGAYSQVRPLIAPGFDNVGHSGQASLRYVHALPRLGALTGHLQFGYDYKYTDNNIEFFGVNVINGAAEVHQFPLIYDGTETDRHGQTTIENDLVYAPGQLSSANRDAAFQGLTPGARAHYIYDRLTVTRTTRLPANLTWVARGVVQISDSVLPNSEQLGAGGVGSVRGYYTDTALGSAGVMTNQEIRLPAFSPSALLRPGSTLGDKAQLGGFFDYAKLRQPRSVLGGEAGATLSSVGVLARYSVGERFDVHFDMGWQLHRAPLETRLGQYGAVTVTVAY